jgi:hypothetical protein
LDGKSFVIIRQAGESGQSTAPSAPATSPKRPPPPVWPSNAATCFSIPRSRPSACIR